MQYEQGLTYGYVKREEMLNIIYSTCSQIACQNVMQPQERLDCVEMHTQADPNVGC